MSSSPSIYCGPCNHERILNQRSESTPPPSTNQLSMRTRRRQYVTTSNDNNSTIPSATPHDEPNEIVNEDKSHITWCSTTTIAIIVIVSFLLNLYSHYTFSVYTKEKLQESSEKLQLVTQEMNKISRELYENHWRRHEITKNGLFSVDNDDDDDGDDDGHENDSGGGCQNNKENRELMIENVVKKRTDLLEKELVTIKKELHLWRTKFKDLANMTQIVDRIDYALEQSGGSIDNIGRNTKAVGNIWKFGIQQEIYEPRKLIQTKMLPGDCFAFYGSSGEVTIRLSKPVFVDAVSIIHISREMSPDGKIDSAPKVFTVSGLYEHHNNGDSIEGSIFVSEPPKEHLFGTFEYSIDLSAEQLQMFEFPKYRLVQNGFRLIRFNFLSNHGNQDHTCVYRVRVHGMRFT